MGLQKLQVSNKMIIISLFLCQGLEMGSQCKCEVEEFTVDPISNAFVQLLTTRFDDQAFGSKCHSCHVTARGLSRYLMPRTISNRKKVIKFKKLIVGSPNCFRTASVVLALMNNVSSTIPPVYTRI